MFRHFFHLFSNNFTYRFSEKLLFGDDWEEIIKKKSYYEGEALLTEKSHSLLFVKDMLATMGYSNTQPSQVLDLSEVLFAFFMAIAVLIS